MRWLLWFLLLSPAVATNSVFLAPAAVGGNTGVDCADAKIFSYFNTAGNWSATPSGIQIGPDTTVHLCSGTYTASAGTSNYLSFQGSGSSGHNVNLVFDSGATVTAPYWSGAALQLGGNSFITIDGGTNGTIQSTANGTGLANQQDNGIGIGSSGTVSSLEIKNLTISNLYVHTCTLPVTNCTDEGGENVYGMRLLVGSTISVHNNTVHDCDWCIYLAYGNGGTTSTSVNVYSNTVSNMNHGVVLGDSAVSSILSSSNCSSSVHDNDFSAMQPWDDAAVNNHHDATHFWANNSASGAKYQGVCLYNNYFHGDGGVNVSGIFTFESLGSANYIFNNIVASTGNTAAADGEIALFAGAGVNGAGNVVVNNTICGVSSTGIMIGVQENGTATVENNLVCSNTAGDGTYVYQASPNTGISVADYNSYQTPAGGNPFWGSCGTGVSFATWKSGCGFDTHGQNVAITLNAAPFTLPSGSVAIAAATNLTGLGISALLNGAPQSFGVSGSCGTGCLLRPSSGAWDAGAFPFTAPVTAPAPILALLESEARD
jgi:hypothetical protein